jgi:hypothetical protein
MNKLIIENRTDLSDFDSLMMIGSVIQEGRISNGDKQYCYFSTSKFNNKRYGISTNLNKNSDRFVITEII